MILQQRCTYFQLYSYYIFYIYKCLVISTENIAHLSLCFVTCAAVVRLYKVLTLQRSLTFSLCWTES